MKDDHIDSFEIYFDSAPFSACGSSAVACDEKLAGRIRRVLAEQAEDVTERRMFGGICFMVGGGMCCGVLGPDLMTTTQSLPR